MNLNGGYAMIKHDATQEELAVAYKTKRPILLYDEDKRAHWAVVEEKATESVDEETQEPITIYEYSYRLIDETVVANPTLSGNEETLEGVEIDGIKYKVGGGTTLDDIVDSQGNKRFIEGNGTLATITGMNASYNKWSLSGTHLMIVLAFTQTIGNDIASNAILSTYELPNYILTKTVSAFNNIVTKIITYSIDAENGLVTAYLIKDDNVLKINLPTGLRASSNRTVRIQFDLLIDNE